MAWLALMVIALIGRAMGNPVSTSGLKPRKPSPEELAGLTEGDMDIPPLTGFRSAISNPNYRWPNGVVPYEFSEKAKAKFSEEEMKNVTAAMEEYHKHTCIRFVPRGQENNYIIISVGDGCSSNVGMMKLVSREGPYGQRLVLGESCFDKGTIMHEMMHALGFFHEHMRWDRDDYVVIRDEYVLQGKLRQFRIFDPERTYKELNAPYDYSSIMHYGPTAFGAFEDIATIVPLKEGANIGQREGFSPVDIWKINTLYKCPDYEGVTLPAQLYSTPKAPEFIADPTPPTKLQEDFYCSFDYLSTCGLRDTFESDFDWQMRGKPTITKGTGPDTDLSGEGNYVYTETTGRKSGDKAFLISPYFKPTPGSCLKFWYHMYGETIGTLRVFTRDYLGNEKDIFKLSGNQGNEWKRVVVTVANDKPFEVVFESTVAGTGTYNQGDMALDYVRMWPISKRPFTGCHY